MATAYCGNCKCIDEQCVRVKYHKGQDGQRLNKMD